MWVIFFKTWKLHNNDYEKWKSGGISELTCMIVATYLTEILISQFWEKAAPFSEEKLYIPQNIVFSQFWVIFTFLDKGSEQKVLKDMSSVQKYRLTKKHQNISISFHSHIHENSCDILNSNLPTPSWQPRFRPQRLTFPPTGKFQKMVIYLAADPNLHPQWAQQLLQN